MQPQARSMHTRINTTHACAHIHTFLVVNGTVNASKVISIKQQQPPAPPPPLNPLERNTCPPVEEWFGPGPLSPARLLLISEIPELSKAVVHRCACDYIKNSFTQFGKKRGKRRNIKKKKRGKRRNRKKKKRGKRRNRRKKKSGKRRNRRKKKRGKRRNRRKKKSGKRRNRRKKKNKRKNYKNEYKDKKKNKEK